MSRRVYIRFLPGHPDYRAAALPAVAACIFRDGGRLLEHTDGSYTIPAILHNNATLITAEPPNHDSSSAAKYRP